MKNSAKTRVYGEDLAVHLRSCQAGVDDDDDDVDDDNVDEVNADDVDKHYDEVDDDNDDDEDGDDIRSHKRSIAAPLSLGVKGLKNNLKEEGLFR